MFEPRAAGISKWSPLSTRSRRSVSSDAPSDARSVLAFGAAVTAGVRALRGSDPEFCRQLSISPVGRLRTRAGQLPDD